MRFAQGKLREGSVASGSEMLRCADPSLRGGVTGLDLAVDEELSRAFEPCLMRVVGRGGVSQDSVTGLLEQAGTCPARAQQVNGARYHL